MSTIPSESELKAARAVLALAAMREAQNEGISISDAADLVAQNTRHNGRTAAWLAGELAVLRSKDNHWRESNAAYIQRAESAERELASASDRAEKLQAERDGACDWINRNCGFTAASPEIEEIHRSVERAKAIRAVVEAAKMVDDWCYIGGSTPQPNCECRNCLLQMELKKLAALETKENQ